MRGRVAPPSAPSPGCAAGGLPCAAASLASITVASGLEGARGWLRALLGDAVLEASPASGLLDHLTPGSGLGPALGCTSRQGARGGYVWICVCAIQMWRWLHDVSAHRAVCALRR